jgi:hypothetical protein
MTQIFRFFPKELINTFVKSGVTIFFPKSAEAEVTDDQDSKIDLKFRPQAKENICNEGS